MQNDQKYWKGLQKGEVHYLGCLYDLYVNDLFAFGMSIVRDKTVVMDGIHDTFLSIYKYHNKLGTVTNGKAYLFQSLKRVLLKQVKSNSKLDSTFSFEKIIPIDNCTKSQETKVIELENVFSLREKLKRAMNLLTKNQQQVIQMRFEQDKSYEEIAESLKITTASARTIIYRAVKTLRSAVFTLVLLLS